jgi:NnrU protein
MPMASSESNSLNARYIMRKARELSSAARGRRRTALGPPYLRAGRDAPRVARHPLLWRLELWCLARCALTGTSLAVAVKLALVSHHCFLVRSGDRWPCDQCDAVWNAHGARMIGAPLCSIAWRTWRCMWSRCKRECAAFCRDPALRTVKGEQCARLLGDVLEDAQ